MSNVPVDLLSQVLGLLTPGQIKELSKFAITEKSKTLTELLLADLQAAVPVDSEVARTSQEQPAIIKIDPEQEIDKSVVSPPTGPEEKVATSLFLILERKNLEKTQKKIQQAEIIKLYQANLAVNIEQERLNKEDLSKSHNIGVLVNKKQA